MSYPVEPKVQVAGVTAAVSGAALWLLGKYVFKGSVPDGVASMIYVATPGVLAFVAAWLAPHQHRDPAPALVAPGQPTPAELDAFRALLAEASGRMEQTAADERVVPPITVSQMVPPSTGPGGTPP
jgi:hypothetical protein